MCILLAAFCRQSGCKGSLHKHNGNDIFCRCWYWHTSCCPSTYWPFWFLWNILWDPQEQWRCERFACVYYWFLLLIISSMNLTVYTCSSVVTDLFIWLRQLPRDWIFFSNQTLYSMYWTFLESNFTKFSACSKICAYFTDIYLRKCVTESMQSGTELVREICLHVAGNLSNWSSGVQISFWALFVLYEVQLDNIYKYFVWLRWNLTLL